MGAMSRNKGSRHELRIGKLLAAWWNADGSLPRGDFRRCPLSGGWDRKRAPGDLLVPERFPWHVEIKAREGWTWDQCMAGRDKDGPRAWYLEALAQATGGRKPVLICTRNRQPDWIVAEPGIIGAYRVALLEPGEMLALEVALLEDVLAGLDPVTVALPVAP